MNPTGTLHIHLLGYFSLTCDAQPITALDQPRLQALLAFLVLQRGVPQSRQQLACLFWPDTTDARARSNFRTLFHRLRQTFPNADRFLLFDAHHVQWRRDGPFCLDVADFEAALAAASSSDSLQAAVDLYTGDLLPSCYDEWIMPARERLHQLFLQSLERLVSQQEALRQFEPAIRNAQRLLRADPLHEAGHRHLMRLHLSLIHISEPTRPY